MTKGGVFYGTCLALGTALMGFTIAFGGLDGDALIAFLSAAVLVVWSGYRLSAPRLEPVPSEIAQTSAEREQIRRAQ